MGYGWRIHMMFKAIKTPFQSASIIEELNMDKSKSRMPVASLRKYPRTYMDLRVEYKSPGRNSVPEDGRTTSLGGGGMMLATSTPLSTGTRLEMFLYYHSIVIPVEAEVVWVKEPRETGYPDYRCGIQYVTKSDQDLMHIQYILQSKE